MMRSFVTSNAIRVIKWVKTRVAGCVARREEGRGAYRVLVGEVEGKRSFGTPVFKMGG
jgi:hypothetical protein